MISKEVFPDNAEVGCVSPVDKQSNDQNEVSNLKPVSVLNIFCKTYESVIKSQLTSVLNNISLPYVATYLKSYKT